MTKEVPSGVGLPVSESSNQDRIYSPTIEESFYEVNEVISKAARLPDEKLINLSGLGNQH
jgi:hypothetical protein